MTSLDTGANTEEREQELLFRLTDWFEQNAAAEEERIEFEYSVYLHFTEQFNFLFLPPTTFECNN
jgi:hypothetical protein